MVPQESVEGDVPATERERGDGERGIDREDGDVGSGAEAGGAEAGGAEAGGEQAGGDWDEPESIRRMIASVVEDEESDEEVPEDEMVEWMTKPWHSTRQGALILGFDVLLTLALVAAAGTTVLADVFGTVTPITDGHIPWYIFAFSLLGALGFVFTALVDDFHTETYGLVKYNLRLPAALPLGAGMYYLAELILGEAAAAAPELVIGLVFLTGLYVNLAYKRLGALARRLLPESTSSEDDEAEASKSAAENGERTAEEVRADEIDAVSPSDMFGKPGQGEDA